MIEASLKCSHGCSLLVIFDRTRIVVLSYLRHLEELGLKTSDDILDGVLEAILLMVVF